MNTLQETLLYFHKCIYLWFITHHTISCDIFKAFHCQMLARLVSHPMLQFKSYGTHTLPR
jgi:hypothetical protein